MDMTDNYSYNEFEALSHELGAEAGARPLNVQFLTISRSAFNKLQKAISERQSEVVAGFTALFQQAERLGLKIAIVGTYDK